MTGRARGQKKRERGGRKREKWTGKENKSVYEKLK